MHLSYLDKGCITKVKVSVRNYTAKLVRALRAEVTKAADGEEVLPITYEDNYIALYPHGSSEEIVGGLRLGQLAE